MNIQQVFAQNMKNIRQECDLTQEKLSEKSGLHRTYIGGIEQGRINVSLKNIGKIADALNTNPAFFFTSLESSEEKQETSTSNKTDKTETSPLKKTEEPEPVIYSLCIQKGTEISFEPIEVDNLDFDIQILCSLIQHNYSAQELPKQFEKTKQELLEYYHYEKEH